MAISALGYAAERIETYDTDIFVGIGSFINPVADPGPDLIYHIGAVNAVTVTGEERLTPADSHGTQLQRGVDLVATWTVMQTGTVEFTELSALLNQRIMVKLSSTVVEYAQGVNTVATQLNASTAAHAADGLEFENAKLTMGFALNYAGEDNAITLTLRCRLSIAQIGDLGTQPILVGN